MERIAPSDKKVQAIKELLGGVGSARDGQDLLSTLVRLSAEKMIQEGLEREQEEYLGRGRYERGGGCGIGRRNGYEPGRLKTGEGVLEVELPQVRGTDEPYRSQLWEHFQKTSESLKQLVVEMYAGGLSTRDIEDSLKRVFGEMVISKTAVSAITDGLLEDFEAFKGRDLSGFEVAYLFMDAVFEPLRRYGSKTGVLCCWGICLDGSKILIDLTTANSESREGVTDFLRGMVRRGLRTPLTITTDGAPGLCSAVDAMWPKSKRIRCWFHKMQNLQNKVPPDAWPEFKSLVQDMRDAPSFEKGKQRLDEIVNKYHNKFPEAVRCLQDDSEASLNHLHVLPRHRQLVRTTNIIERTFVEERRRTTTIPHLWDETSLIKLVFAVLIRVSDRWSRKSFSDVECKHLLAQRQALEASEKGGSIQLQDKKMPRVA